MLVLAVGPAFAATVLYVYDELGRLVAEIDPAAETTLYTYDAAGNLLSVGRGTSSAFRLVAFAPTRGYTGDVVTIYGSGFVADPAQNTVSFNGTPALVTAATANTLIVTVPSGVTTGPISVSNGHGSAATPQPFTVVPPPVVAAIAPASVRRGETARLVITGERLSTAMAVNFQQGGLAARLLPDATEGELTIDLSVAGEVPLGTYSFDLVTAVGSANSGTVTVTVTTALIGDALTVTHPFSVHLPGFSAGVSPGDSMTRATGPVSVHLPEVVSGAGGGNSMSPATAPVSVHLPAAATGTGDAVTVTEPVSISMP